MFDTPKCIWIYLSEFLEIRDICNLTLVCKYFKFLEQKSAIAICREFVYIPHTHAKPNIARWCRNFNDRCGPIAKFNADYHNYVESLKSHYNKNLTVYNNCQSYAELYAASQLHMNYADYVNIAYNLCFTNHIEFLIKKIALFIPKNQHLYAFNELLRIHNPMYCLLYWINYVITNEPYRYIVNDAPLEINTFFIDKYPAIMTHLNIKKNNRTNLW